MIYSTVTASITRPSDTTAYASGDLIANSTTAGSVTALQFGTPAFSQIVRATLTKTNTTNTNATFLLHLFSAAPTVTNGDNGAIAIATNNGTYLGSVAIDSSVGTGLGGSVAFTQGIPVFGNTFGLLSATAAYTPASAEVLTVRLFIES